MGGKESKSFPITAEEAAKRVTDAERGRLQASYRRLTATSPSSSSGLSRSLFVRHVLGDCVPHALADAIFTACGGGGKGGAANGNGTLGSSLGGDRGGGLGFKDVLNLLVLITRGSREEKLKFIFGLLSTEGGVIEKDELVRTLKEFEPGVDFRHIAALFEHGDKASYEDFCRWEESHPHALGLFDWLLWPETGRLSLVSKEDTPTFYQTLAGVTHLEEPEIVELEKRFWELAGDAGAGRIDVDTLSPLVSPPLPAVLVEPLFSAFDENQDGLIDFKELSCGVSAACRGPEMERQKFSFKIFDGDRDGVLSRGEVSTMCRCLMDVRWQGAAATKVEQGELRAMTDALWERHDPHGRGVLTLEEFLVWTVDNPYPHEFSKMIFQLCHIVLGLKPLTRKEEGLIVRGWLERETGAMMGRESNSSKLSVGSVWHLISMEWWTAWNNYVNGHDAPGGGGAANGHGRVSDLISGKRGGRKPPSLESTLASDHDKGVVGTSYHQISDNQNFSYGSLGRSTAPNSLDTLSTSSRGHTPSASPYSSRKNSSSSSINSTHGSYNLFPRPGVIDNSSLVQPLSYRVSTLTSEGGKLKSSPRPTRGKDFELIPQRLWKALVNWYGGSPALPRHVIKTKDGRVELELNPLSLKLMKHQTVARPTSAAATASAVSSGFVGGFGAAAGATAGLALPSSAPSSSSAYSSSSSPGGTVTRRYHAYQCAFSRRTRVAQATEFLSQKLHVKPEDMRLWRFRSEQEMHLLEDETADLEECGFGDDDSLLMEVRSRDGTWPEEITSLYKSTSAGDRRASAVLGSGTYSVKGITGLNNLGNTCYMNSSVQCVANTRILSEYFNRNCHLYELNRSNPLGMKGHIAKRFGDLVRDMWASDTRTIAPIKLRWTIGKYRPQFAGFQQHDAQELLAFLLDGLHEDLNRVTEHPYVELKDSDGRPDAEVAKEAWDNHVLRNKSVIIDLFHGQLKSKVICKVCSHESVRFDPFSILSLPLPMESSVHIEVIVIRQDGSIPIKYGLNLNMEARFSSLKTSLSKACNIPQENLILVDIVQSQFRAIPPEEQKLKSLNGTCIFAYEFYSLIRPVGHQTKVDQSFSDIQRGSRPGTAAGKKLNGTADRSGAAAKSGVEVREDGGGGGGGSGEHAKKTKSSCMNGITFCFKSGKDPEQTSMELKGSSPKEGKKSDQPHPKRATPDSPKSDKDSLLANGYPPHQRNGPSSSDRGHSRAGSSASSVASSHDGHGAASGHGDNAHGAPVVAVSPEDIGNCQHGVIVALHRKMVPQEVYFLSMEKYRPVLFGLPLVLPCSEETTFQDLYKAVWTQVSRLVSPLPPRDGAHNHATDCDDSLRYEYPFTLKLVQKEGAWCSCCPWHRFCRGCPVPCTTKNFNFGSSYLAIDWDQTALHLRYHTAQERAFKSDVSVAASVRAASEPITLHKCLEAFTRAEELGPDEKYYCSRCKTHQLASKKLQIWRLPPVLIVQLKRFHYLNGRWIKSHKIVDFPSKDVDLTEFLAAVPSTTLKRFKSLKKRKPSSPLANGTIAEKPEPDSKEGSTSSQTVDPAGANADDRSSVASSSLSKDAASVVRRLGGAALADDDSESNDDTVRSVVSAASGGQAEAARGAYQRRRLESTSLLSAPVRDDNLEDFHQHRLDGAHHPLDVKYNLYSMVCHSGVLGGGHYISYGRSTSGKWYCQNDSSCKEVQESQIDKTTAYMLFYEREGLSVKDYLPPVSELAPDVKDLDDELEADFKKQCAIM